MGLAQRLSANRLCGTGLFACSAANAFRGVCVFYRIHLHFADICACITACAAAGIDPVAKYGHRIKNRINGSQWADVFAKRPVNQDGESNGNNQQRVFPCIQPSDGASHRGIQQYQRKSPLQSADRADKFAEVRRALAKDVYGKHGQQNDKQKQN